VLATGCGTTLNQDVLLDELFPGDTSLAAEVLLKSKLSILQSQALNSSDAQSSLVESDQNLTGLSYQWCNILGGLYQVPSDDVGVDGLVRNTRAVVIELMRRVRSNAILKFCIQAFKKHCIPDIPNLPDSRNEFCQLLHGWKINQFVGTIQSECGVCNDMMIHEVHFQKESYSFVANLHLHRSRYPSVPPIWKIPTEHDGQQLFNNQIAHVELAVNEEVLRRYEHDERYAAWIILIQVFELVTRWENMLLVEDGAQNCPIRRKRGRDHVLP
jgi:hypothetical protein